MLSYLLRSAGSSLLALALILVSIFVIFQVIGDPARRALPLNASEEQVQAYREAHGYDDPVLEQFGRYMSGAIRLDFGESTSAGEPALPLVMSTLPRSLVLAGAAFLTTAVFGLLLGIAAGVSQGNLVDRSVQVVGSVASSIPEFWSGLVLIIVFGVTLGLLPTGGYGGLAYVVLPAAAMSIPPMGRLIYVVRESIQSVLREPYVLVARSKGLRRTRLITRHVLRAAVIPIISIGALELTRLAIGGVIVIEAVFAWPGIGKIGRAHV